MLAACFAPTICWKRYTLDRKANAINTASIEGIKAPIGQWVRQKTDAGIDIIDDGESGKAGFIGYVNARLAGFETAITSTSTTSCLAMRL
jgi:hypothetical protein